MKGDTAIVNFPCVHGAHTGEIIKVTCFQADELKGIIKTLSGIEEVSAINIIGATRHGENNSAAAKGVMATVSNPNFSGRSYGLALAIADKLARYQKCSNLNQVFATGRIESDGCGKVSSIDCLIAKIRMVAENIKKGDIFIFPDQTENEEGSAQKELLRLIEGKGAHWKAISDICELGDLVWYDKQSMSSREAGKATIPWILGGGSLIIAVIIIAVYLGLRFMSPKIILEDSAEEPRAIIHSNEQVSGGALKQKQAQKIKPISIPTNAY